MVKRNSEDLGAKTSDQASLYSGSEILRRLVCERYGERDRAFIEHSIRVQGLGLVWSASAFWRCIAAIARSRRRCYCASLRYVPLELKTYLRLLWAGLPQPLTRALVAMLTPRLRRSLNGPPFHSLRDRPQ